MLDEVFQTRLRFRPLLTEEVVPRLRKWYGMGGPHLRRPHLFPARTPGDPGGVPLPEKHVHHARPDPFRNSWAAPHLRPQYAAAPRPAPARPWAGLLLDILAGG